MFSYPTLQGQLVGHGVHGNLKDERIQESVSFQLDYIEK